ncbi:hypothetical protein PV10_06766 [Exophiala mesophila]|uniref:Uncharacterized protein n=1 Tax=Exophiala mesophila TaxID=212818 RepID=A0A0D1ZEE5_EXOME|nr:uncharacterized protein PV10_06766 [Exophiala mesophila]KIV92314.1 hypothetical protein PV10_06766 [Exophiala mesophila]
MATLAPSNTHMRQPFGVLNESKIRSLQSVKNRQNATSSSPAPSRKRRAVSPEISDSENVDPNLLDSLHKRKRSTFDDDVHLHKPRYSLNITSTTPKRHLDSPLMSTPRLNTSMKPTSAPMSAPPAAGRSPTRRRPTGLLNAKKRFAQPSFGATSSSLSISAALSGTLASRKTRNSVSTKKTLDSRPNSWFFDIFEETEQVQDYRMNEWTMTESAYSLDISDDEKKGKEGLDRGKENVDPNESSAPVTRSMAAAAAAGTNSLAKSRASKRSPDDMVDDRIPLGDLNPTEYYGEGLDATSVVLVHDDAAVSEPDVPRSLVTAEKEFTFLAAVTTATASSSMSLTAQAIETLDTPSISQILSSASPEGTLLMAKVDDNIQPAGSETMDHADIEIWESESAKDETEQPECDHLCDQGSVDHEQAFALAEL